MKIAMLGPTDTVHFCRLVRAIAERGHDVHVVSMKPDPVPGATFERFSVPRFGWLYPYRWRKRRDAWLSRLFRRFDVVNVHFLADWGITPASVRNGRLIVTAYGSDVDHPPNTPPPHPSLVVVRKQLLRLADCVVAPSKRFAEKVAEFAKLDVADIEVLSFGVDTSLFAPREGNGNGNGGPVVGYYKGFEPVYGPLVMIDAIANVSARRPDVRFELIGEGAQLAQSKERAAALGLGEVITWHDRVPEAAIPSHKSRWAVVAISSFKESFCVAAIEAAAMGLPVVATDVGGLTESVERDVTGLLVPPGDPEALGGAILTLLENEGLRREMGSRGRRRVQQLFEWDACVDRWLELFERVRDSRRKGARNTLVRVTRG